MVKSQFGFSFPADPEAWSAHTELKKERQDGGPGVAPVAPAWPRRGPGVAPSTLHTTH